MAYEVPVPVRLGLVETAAATCRARYGYWPQDYMMMVRMYCAGEIPQRVHQLARELAAFKPWAVPDQEHNPHPGMTRVWFGPHSFLVPTTEVIGARTP